MKRIAILGGGLSGLSAAYQLARDGRAEFTLFEASHRLGGIVETVRQDGFTVECGPDAWVTEKPWARELAVELGLESELTPSNDVRRRTYLLRDNQLIPMPEGMRMMVPTQLASIMDSPLFSEQARIACQREPARASELKAFALRHDHDESVADFVRRHFGEEVTRTFAAPLLSGVFGGSIETLSARAVLPAFIKMEREHGSLVLALQSRKPEMEQPIFTTLRSGLGTLVDRIVASLPPKNLRVSAPVNALVREGHRWRVHTANAAELFDAVIVATPAHITRRLLRNLNPGFDPLLAMDATSAIVVALAFAPEEACDFHTPDGFGYLIPQQPCTNQPQLLACTFVDQKFPHRVPAESKLLRAFFGGEAAATVLNENNKSLTALARQQLVHALGPLPPSQLTVVRRWPLSLPQYAVGHLDRMAKLESLTQEIPGLHLVGNAYYGVGLPDMVRMGREAAIASTSP